MSDQAHEDGEREAKLRRASMRVLFVHGLESQPNGSKTRLLREQGFEVVAPDMHMGLFLWRRKNSVVRQLLRLGETRLVLAGFLGLGGFAIKRSSLVTGVATLAAAGVWALARREALFAKAMSRSFDASVAIVREAMKRVDPDVVVGSSWGGAVSAELVMNGDWSGPTVLLAPAIHKIATATRRPDAASITTRLRAESLRAPMIIFHDPSDDVVPFADSLELAHDSNIDLRSVDAGGHRLLALLERGELAETIEALLGDRSPKRE